MTAGGALWPERVYFARHGRTAMNTAGLVMGGIDAPLDPLGEGDAQAVARSLAGRPVSGLLASPMRRAADTAERLAAALAVEVAFDGRLAERRWGSYEGRPRGERPALLDPPTAEPWRDFRRRVEAALVDGRRTGALAEEVLIVAHAGVYRAVAEILGTSSPGLPALGHGVVVEIRRAGAGFAFTPVAPGS